MKNLKLLLTSTFMLAMTIGVNAQYCMDGSYCPILGETPGNCASTTVVDEWADAQFVVVNSPPSGTCEIGTVYGDFAQDALGDWTFYFGLSHGNNGQATFRFYLNTDCDSLTGALTAYESGTSGATVNVSGAEFRMMITSNGSTALIEEWDTTVGDFVTSSATAFVGIGNSDGCLGSDGSFKELSVPFSNLFDPCKSFCSSVTLTTVLANAGGSPSSNFCVSPPIVIDIPVNVPPIPDFIIDQDTACEHPLGTFPTVNIDASLTIDSNLVEGDSLYYVWASDNTGAFSNPSGGPIGEGEMASISTSYSTTAVGDHNITLTVTDQFLCDSSTNQGATGFKFVVLPKTDIECFDLPVELMNFSIDMLRNIAVVNWITASEINNDYFIIEHALNGLEFKEIGRVESQNGNSNQMQVYEFMHNNPGVGVNYYRLKQVDFNGEHSYSDTRTETYNGVSGLSIYPNPSNGLIQIDMPETIDHSSRIEIYNSFGRLEKSFENAGENNSVLQLDLKELSSGIYFIQIKTAEKMYRQPVIIEN